jgi:sterol desaturase/sphingolipid hydroxylase (fatty acid hydroxylase superfamily)
MPFFFLLASNRLFCEAGNFFIDMGKTFLAYLLFRTWSFTVHIIMHKTPSLIKYHKQHHLPMHEMTCISTFTDSMAEFLLMELLAEIAGIWLVGGLPLFNLILLGIYNVVNGAFDHSGFCLDKFWFNSIYHYNHHA